MANFNWEYVRELGEEYEKFVGMNLEKGGNWYCDKRVSSSDKRVGLDLLTDVTTHMLNMEDLSTDTEAAESYRQQILDAEADAALDSETESYVDQIQALEVYRCDNMELIYFCDGENEYVMALHDNDFVIVGSSGAHSMVLVNHNDQSWTYFNSDGSSPSIIRKKNYSLANICKRVIPYYKSCCRNSWH